MHKGWRNLEKKNFDGWREDTGGHRLYFDVPSRLFGKEGHLISWLTTVKEQTVGLSSRNMTEGGQTELRGLAVSLYSMWKLRKK